MKTIKLVAAVCAFAAVIPAFAGTPMGGGTITFEDPGLFGKDVGSYYAGVTFSGATVTTVSSGYPGDGSYNIMDTSPSATISIKFDAPQTSVSFLYASLIGIQVVAFDSNGVMLSGAPGTGVLPGTGGFGTGPSTASSDTITASDISFVGFIDLAGIPGFEVLDDISAPGITGLPAPDATSTLGLFGVASLGLLLFRRKFAAC